MGSQRSYDPLRLAYLGALKPSELLEELYDRAVLLLMALIASAVLAPKILSAYTPEELVERASTIVFWILVLLPLLLPAVFLVFPGFHLP